jgi:cysteine desulfuration protein SufE
MNPVVAKLDQLHAEFAELEPRERLELLLEFAEGLPPLPPRLQAEKDAGSHRIPECMTPVFIWVEQHAGLVKVFADVAPEAPTVKGFVGILADVLRIRPMFCRHRATWSINWV